MEILEDQLEVIQDQDLDQVQYLEAAQEPLEVLDKELQLVWS